MKRTRVKTATDRRLEEVHQRLAAERAEWVATAGLLAYQTHLLRQQAERPAELRSLRLDRGARKDKAEQLQIVELA